MKNLQLKLEIFLCPIVIAFSLDDVETANTSSKTGKKVFKKESNLWEDNSIQRNRKNYERNRHKKNPNLSIGTFHFALIQNYNFNFAAIAAGTAFLCNKIAVALYFAKSLDMYKYPL